MTKAEQELQEKSALGAKYGPNVFCSNHPYYSGGIAHSAMDSAANERAEARIKALADKRAAEKSAAKKAAVAVDHRADDDALANLVRMKPAQRATAFEREARGERVGLNDKLVELRERLEIPEGEEEEQRNAIKGFWNSQHQRNTLNNDLKL